MVENLLRWVEEVSGRPTVAEARPVVNGIASLGGSR
jgi:hypothetical protein